MTRIESTDSYGRTWAATIHPVTIYHVDITVADEEAIAVTATIEHPVEPDLDELTRLLDLYKADHCWKQFDVFDLAAEDELDD